MSRPQPQPSSRGGARAFSTGSRSVPIESADSKIFGWPSHSSSRRTSASVRTSSPSRARTASDASRSRQTLKAGCASLGTSWDPAGGARLAGEYLPWRT